MSGACSTYGSEIYVRIWWRDVRPVARCMRVLEDNIKMHFKQDGRSWTRINLAQGRYSWLAVAIPCTARKRLTGWANVRFSWQTRCVEVANSVLCLGSWSTWRVVWAWLLDELEIFLCPVIPSIPVFPPPPIHLPIILVSFRFQPTVISRFYAFFARSASSEGLMWKLCSVYQPPLFHFPYFTVLRRDSAADRLR
jgi:hypothetical protein